MLKKLIRNDKAIKFIFDHYKNFAIAAVILTVGISLLLSDKESGFFEAMRIMSGICVTIVGLFLVIINERHGIYKLEEAKLKLSLHITILIIYSLSMIAIVVGLTIHNLK